MTMTATRTLVVEDHTVFAEMLRDRLDGAGYHVVDVVPSQPAALEAVIKHKVDLVLCDVSLHESDGVQLARELTSAHPNVKVVMLSGDNHSDLVHAARRAGACGYVSKSAPGGMRELLECIDEAVNGADELAADRATYRKLYAHSLVAAEAGLAAGARQPSAREQDVLRVMLVDGATSNREIARVLGLAEGTVRTHIEHLFRKFGVGSRTGLVLRAAECGWRDRLRTAAV